MYQINKSISYVQFYLTTTITHEPSFAENACESNFGITYVSTFHKLLELMLVMIFYPPALHQLVYKVVQKVQQSVEKEYTREEQVLLEL